MKTKFWVFVWKYESEWHLWGQFDTEEEAIEYIGDELLTTKYDVKIEKVYV